MHSHRPSRLTNPGLCVTRGLGLAHGHGQKLKCEHRAGPALRPLVSAARRCVPVFHSPEAPPPARSRSEEDPEQSASVGPDFLNAGGFLEVLPKAFPGFAVHDGRVFSVILTEILGGWAFCVVPSS